ncbi:peptide methionine sulfoxide reductase B8 [Strigomonas culicis]|uniref:Peptide methionine sulfoxide reductase B8 n=1 Tax=Strigomonas culicis TaxID=28005 RepID=S9UDA6_9TRYP|nr:peptide methionine sulfoxide reductase B8 [Strigomonas culicis]EPY31045.1 peptide methionine sulfoxide reductase B8 [Strigomonas culicis]|eukprot:EPY26709.1 peptide methionine sulfoxide reductase B8 [Strigomonas culicis]
MRSLLSSHPSLTSKFRALITATTTRSFYTMSTPTTFTHCVPADQPNGSKDVDDATWRTKLSAHEYFILREKGTDARHGPLDKVFAPGDYFCAGCGTHLYTAGMKYDCGCGWPGFWDCVPGVVREQPDKDGRRTEIVCNLCNSHLGHVFRGEGFTNPPPNERHCVNDTAVKFVPAESK